MKLNPNDLIAFIEKVFADEGPDQIRHTDPYMTCEFYVKWACNIVAHYCPTQPQCFGLALEGFRTYRPHVSPKFAYPNPDPQFWHAMFYIDDHHIVDFTARQLDQTGPATMVYTIDVIQAEWCRVGVLTQISPSKISANSRGIIPRLEIFSL